MTVTKYIIVVALIYIVALFSVIALVGGIDLGNPKELIRFWPVPLGAIALAYLGTMTAIYRFGNATGSIYFLPTVFHAAMILLMTIGAIFA